MSLKLSGQDSLFISLFHLTSTHVQMELVLTRQGKKKIYQMSEEDAGRRRMREQFHSTSDPPTEVVTEHNRGEMTSVWTGV